MATVDPGGISPSWSIGGVTGFGSQTTFGGEHPHTNKHGLMNMAVGQNRCPKWNPGKWTAGLKPANKNPGGFFLSHTHTMGGRNPFRTTVQTP